MLQKKASDKLGSQTESKKSPAQFECHFSSHHRHETRSKGGSDLKKMIKSKSFKGLNLGGLRRSLSRKRNGQSSKPPKPSTTKASDGLPNYMISLRRSLSRRRNGQLSKPPKPSTTKASDGLPNYMKPTSSSDAKKERLQLTAHSPKTNGKNKDRVSSNNSNYPKRVSLSATNSGNKPAKNLARKSSFRLRRPSMKKSSRVALHPRSMNRATCSSALKDSRVPKALDLNSGGTESDGTSFIKVCPYTYCSLNGHRRETLPPLRRFLSARRRLLKTQKSMRLKGLSSFRKRSSRKVGEDISYEQITISRSPSGLNIGSVIEEISNDFFVEIYAKPQEQIRELEHYHESSFQEDLNREIAEVLNTLTLMRNEYSKVGTEEDDLRATENKIPETYSDISFGYDLDQHSENSSENLEHNQQADAEEETFLCFVPEVNEEGNPALCIMDGSERQHNSVSDGENKDNTIITTGTEEENENGVEDAIANTEAQSSDSHQRFVNTDQVITEGDCSQSEAEIENSRFKDATENSGSPDTHHFTSTDQSDKSYSEVNQQQEKEEQADCAGAGIESPEITIISEAEAPVADQTLHEASGNQQARHNVHKEKMIEHSDEMKEFNPKQPNFLAIEPDPEAEKAYLRHHSMDKRKDADAWMIDFALQKIVTKLAPARREKVALLVDAFEKVKACETVAPHSLCESPLQSPTSGIVDASHAQACS